MKTCISHKKMYPSQEIAEDALIEARTNYQYAANKGPITVYKCGDCGYFHLTSQGTMNEKLAIQFNTGKIKLQREANQWINKMKKR